MLKRLLVLVGFGASLLGPGAGQAVASQACGGGNYSNAWDGATTNNITTYGAYAYINTRPGAICTGGNGGDSAWTMVAENSSGHGGYAQSGYATFTAQPTARYFSQYRRSSSYVPTSVYGTVASGTVQYMTNYQFGPGHLSMYVNGVVYDQTNFDPAAGIWVAPWCPEYSGETLRPQDDMPGTTSAHATFSSIRYVASRSSGWMSLPSAYWFSMSNSRYHHSGNAGQFDIWTDPLS